MVDTGNINTGNAELDEKIIEWLKWDKNEKTKNAILKLVSGKDNATLEKLLLNRLTFGTAGLRGVMGPGYAAMNDLVIVQTTQGLAKYLLASEPRVKEKGVVIGYDARYNSHSRHLAETSPYFEGLKQKDVEVLFCYEPYDELVLVQLRQFDRRYVISMEKEIRREKEDTSVEDLGEDSLSKSEATSLVDWLKGTLGNKAHKVKITKRLSSHPCLVSVEEMAAARHFVMHIYSVHSRRPEV
ncbi:heat shock cognate 90 kDa protein-like [Tachypleus tridentatus]|uniref:heat shock cognate 90 kDa protein-like n=1 Tax=Tachypleus tridentatus TaxID=6853 RepID=UPI003FD65789